MGIYIKPLVMNQSQAAQYLGKDRHYISDLIKQGWLTLYKLPNAKRRVLRTDELEKLPLPVDVALDSY